MKKVHLTGVSIGLFALLTVPGWAQGHGAGRPSAPPPSNQGGATTGLNQAGKAQTMNPTGAAATGLQTAGKNASPKAGGSGSHGPSGHSKGKAKGKK